MDKTVKYHEVDLQSKDEEELQVDYSFAIKPIDGKKDEGDQNTGDGIPFLNDLDLSRHIGIDEVIDIDGKAHPSAEVEGSRAFFLPTLSYPLPTC